MRFFAGPRLLVIDEVGYLPLGQRGRRRPVPGHHHQIPEELDGIDHQLGIASWGKIFDDPMVAAAMLDRLLHRSVVFNIDGDSYRMRAHRARSENIRKGVTAHG